MQVEDRLIKSIIVADRYRKDYGDLTELIESIREKGVIQPITIDDGARLLAGGRRLEAASQAGFEVIPCIVRPTRDNIDALEIELFENIHRKDFLWAERARLEKALLDLKKAKDPNWTQRDQADVTNASVGAVNRRLQMAEYLEAIPELKDMKNEDEAWKAVKKFEEKLITDALVQKAKSGALKGVKIADKSYKVGDVLEGMSKLRDSSYAFAEVDPPYGVDIDRRKSRNTDGGGTEEYREIAGKDYSAFIHNLATETFRVLNEHAFCIWWYGMSWHTETLAILREVGFQVNDIPAIWYKNAQGQTASPDTALGSSYEPFFICRKGQPKLAKPGRSNVFHFDPVPAVKKIHPTEKPVELLHEILHTFTYPGARIVVPLLGSGVTIRAAFSTGRIAFGWDLSGEHKNRFLAKVAEEEEMGIYENPPAHFKGK